MPGFNMMKGLIKYKSVCCMLAILVCLLAGCQNEKSSSGIKSMTKREDSKPAEHEDIVIRIEDDSDNYDRKDTAITEVVESGDSMTNDTMEETDMVKLPSTEDIFLNMEWKYAEFSKINSGKAVLYRAASDRKNIVIGMNAGHGTKGGQSVKTQCHPDGSAKVTGGTTAAGSTSAVAVSGGMTFLDGTPESSVTLTEANLVKEKLINNGYDVLMLRDDSDVQLDNIARTVIANNNADCLISLHWDGDGLSYDKGCFYISTPDGIKGMEPVSSNWQEHEKLGESLVKGLTNYNCKIYSNGKMSIDLTQTSYSTIPSIDIELGNAASAHDETTLDALASGLADGIDVFFSR